MMRFKCQDCNMDLHHSLLNDAEYRLYRRKIIGINGLTCPFCHRTRLEVVE